DVEAAAGNFVELLSQPFRAAWKVRREDQSARVGKQFGSLFRQSFNARPARGQRVGRFALRTRLRALFEMAAIMTQQRAAKPMFDEPGRTIWTLETMSAGSTQGQRRIASPI